MTRIYSFCFNLFLLNVLVAQAPQRLSAPEFATLLKTYPQAPLIDVRSVAEFQGGHLEKAVNYPVNSAEFNQKTSTFDKKKPVFVYCLSGARSNAAAQQLLSAGFTHVYDMAGGMMQWRANGLPESKAASARKGMTLKEFTALTTSRSLVLIDFYADWCAPCKKMKPFLEEIDQEMASQVDVVRIDADAEKELCQMMKVDALPVLILYKNGKEVWKHKAFISKEDLVAKIKQFTNK